MAFPAVGEKTAGTQGLTQFVDVFIGTGGHGHTYPGATVPFWMVQLSPDTWTGGWDHCSGYHHDDASIRRGGPDIPDLWHPEAATRNGH